MSLVRSVLLLSVAACGRIAFDPLTDATGNGDGGTMIDAGPGLVSLTVHGQQGDDNDGVPVADAYVVFVANGTETVARTDANGAASAIVGGATDVHVAWPVTVGGSPGWRVTSFSGVGGGANLAVGDRDANRAAPNTITVNVPTVGGAMLYEVGFPSNCSDGPYSAMSTTVSVPFTEACEGQSVPAWAYAADASGIIRYADLGMITLVDGANISPAVNWQTASLQTVRVENMPFSPLFATVPMFRRGAVPIRICEAAISGPGSFDVQCRGLPVVPDQIGMFAVIDARRYVIVSSPATPPFTIDISKVPRIPTSATADPNNASLEWTFDTVQNPGTVLFVNRRAQAAGVTVNWTYYLPPMSRTSLSLDDLPAALSSVIPTTYGSMVGEVTSIALGNLDYAGVIERVDGELALFFDRGHIELAAAGLTTQP